jgi:hypothetical protein
MDTGDKKTIQDYDKRPPKEHQAGNGPLESLHNA